MLTFEGQPIQGASPIIEKLVVSTFLSPAFGTTLNPTSSRVYHSARRSTRSQHLMPNLRPQAPPASLFLWLDYWWYVKILDIVSSIPWFLISSTIWCDLGRWQWKPSPIQSGLPAYTRCRFLLCVGLPSFADCKPSNEFLGSMISSVSITVEDRNLSKTKPEARSYYRDDRMTRCTDCV